MESLTIKAPAKINWMLDILGRREDGYHLLRMIMQKITLYDRITLGKSPRDSFTCQDMALENQANLAFKAWLNLKSELALKDCLAISLEKQIPTAAGLAGGSADAAAVLNGANQLLELNLSLEYLQKTALKLGADIPFCLLEGPALVEGIGEKITPLENIPPFDLVIANPGIQVSTPWAFKAYDKLPPQGHIDQLAFISALRLGDPHKIGALLENHLEQAVIPVHPQIAQLKAQMQNLGLSPLMSGSGASVFGLAPNEAAAIKAWEKLKADWPFVQKVKTI